MKRTLKKHLPYTATEARQRIGHAALQGGHAALQAGRAPLAVHQPILIMGPPGRRALRVPVEAGGVCVVVQVSCAGELCRLTVVWADCRCFLSLVFLSGARRLELSLCNTAGSHPQLFTFKITFTFTSTWSTGTRPQETCNTPAADVSLGYSPTRWDWRCEYLLLVHHLSPRREPCHGMAVLSYQDSGHH